MLKIYLYYVILRRLEVILRVMEEYQVFKQRNGIIIFVFLKSFCSYGVDN